MGNDYLDALPGGYSGILEADGWVDLDATFEATKHRDRLVRKFAWAIPTDAALDLILDVSKEIVEVGAGRGYWAYLLAERGATVHAFDNGSWTIHSEVQPWFDVRRGGPEVIDLHPTAAVFICWPPYDDPMALDVASRVRVGQSLVYIGEGESGCNGSDEFWNLIHSEFERTGGCALPQWWGLHDGLDVFERRAR